MKVTYNLNRNKNDDLWPKTFDVKGLKKQKFGRKWNFSISHDIRFPFFFALSCLMFFNANTLDWIFIDPKGFVSIKNIFYYICLVVYFSLYSKVNNNMYVKEITALGLCRCYVKNWMKWNIFLPFLKGFYLWLSKKALLLIE